MTWREFAGQAPHIAEIFERRHAATENLCMLGTIRSDGYPRISPVEPTLFDDQLVVVGMPGTTKFIDLLRDPRFCLHTATVDTYVSEGDVKLWADAINLQEPAFHERFAEHLHQSTGMDLTGEVFDPFFVADIVGASSVELEDNQLAITIWKPGEAERRVTKT